MLSLATKLNFNQKNRFLQVKTPLGAEELMLESLDGEELVSRPFHFRLMLVSEDANLELKRLIGQPVEVALQTAHPVRRFFHGYISQFSLVGTEKHFNLYEARLVPWLHFLDLRTNCRLFQEKTTLEIVETLFKDYGALADYDIQVSGKYQTRSLCVQYNETDLDFISRLLESEGIYYFFTFAAGRHTLCIRDTSSSAKDMPCQARIPFRREFGVAESDNIHSWNSHRAAVSNQYAVTTYDYKQPGLEQVTQVKASRNLGKLPPLENYEHHGAYAYKDYKAGDDFAKLRMEEHEFSSKHFSAQSNVRTLTCGHIFELTGHDGVGTGDERRFFVLRVRHSAQNNLDGKGESHYDNTFTCSRKIIPFRPGLLTPGPVMRGPQTALVVGPKDEDIYCDELGRVKVQFYWDREGKKDDQSSCWMRVATSWAGKRFGFISIPRVGTEVIVGFLEGNPDRPIITGAVYNQAQMPPWDLPNNKTQSGVATRSSKTGGYENANALRFEDKKGEEEVWLHAEKDQRIEVEHDEKHEVGNDRVKHVKHDETVTVDNNRTETVGVNEDITIGANRTEMVGANEQITIGANRTETVLANETVTISGHQNLTVLMTKNENILITDTQQVGAAKTTTVGGAYALTVGLGKNEAVGLASAEEVGLNKTTLVGKSYHITAADELTITVGKSQLSMKKDGTISINGKNIDLGSTADTTIKAKGNLVQKGTKILEN